eukprot:scpid109121/ scgid26826/ 
MPECLFPLPSLICCCYCVDPLVNVMLFKSTRGLKPASGSGEVYVQVCTCTCVRQWGNDVVIPLLLCNAVVRLVLPCAHRIANPLIYPTSALRSISDALLNTTHTCMQFSVVRVANILWKEEAQCLMFNVSCASPIQYQYSCSFSCHACCRHHVM